MTKRILFDVLFLGVIFYAPWWVVAVFAFAGVFFFPSYYEVIAGGVLFDLLYGASNYFTRGIIGFLSTLVLFVVARRLKRAVRS